MLEKTKWVPPTSYIKCREILSDLHKFQYLIRHHKGYNLEKLPTPKIEKLIPDEITNKNTYLLLEQKINRFIPIISRYLFIAGINPVVVQTKSSQQYDDKYHILKKVDHETNEMELIVNYFNNPNDYSVFEQTTHCLDQAIGFYSYRKKKALIELFNPLHWIAFVLRMPLRILRLAGLESSNKIIEDVYGWVIKILIFAVLTLELAKRGFSISLDNLLPFLKQ